MAQFSYNQLVDKSWGMSLAQHVEITVGDIVKYRKELLQKQQGWANTGYQNQPKHL